MKQINRTISLLLVLTLLLTCIPQISLTAKAETSGYYTYFNISEDEGIILTNYFEALALIGIEYLNNKKINELNYE